jgi:alkylglycerol monooxygenase
MELYGKVLVWAMPIFLILVLLEKMYGVWRDNDTYHNMDMISSMSSGATNAVKDVLGLSISILSYHYLVGKLAIFTIESSFLAFAITFVVLDFQGYWTHRWAHKINFFWNKHAIHHSSEEFNLACALRQSISSFVNFFTFFLIPAAIFGVPSEIIAIVGPIHLFAQFWYHTRHIDRMGILENVIVTPSHHRVHHAINEVYMDKNYGQIFILWDKWFGTFQEELDTVPPVYGITRPAQTWNPIKINFQHISLLALDAWRAESWSDKLSIWWKPTGWRPADVEAKYPVPKIDDPYNFEKYRPTASFALNCWAWVQMLITFAFIMYFFGNIGQMQKVHDLYHFFVTPNILIYGCFAFLSVYAYTELMDNNPYAIFWETAKNAMGLGLLYTYQDWFGVAAKYPMALYFIGAYFVLATVVTFLIGRKNI